MNSRRILILFLVSILSVSICLGSAVRREDLAELMKQSVVSLETSFHGYEQIQPWRNKALTQSHAHACAVGEYEVLTTAWNVANLAHVKALRYGQNEFIGAKIKLIDYETNLCLIQLDPNAMAEPLKPIVFSEDYAKGAEVDFYWLSSDNNIYNGRAYLDRARLRKARASYEKRLHYVVANTSRQTSTGQLYCMGGKPIGIACWSNSSMEAGLVPAELINAFLAAAAKGEYKGFGAAGFAVSELLDPAMRSFLKMPASLKDGVYVSDVYTIGTASDVLRQGDVILAIGGMRLNSYGRFEHAGYGQLDFEHLITTRNVGEELTFEIFRDGREMTVKADVKNFNADEMLVPYHEYDRQPEYIVTGGFILQKLTREFLEQWGDDWEGKVSPHMYHYYRDFAYKPTAERSDIVILSYVLPSPMSLGYKDLGQIVVSKVNGMKIRSISDVLAARKLNPGAAYDVIEFEMDKPAVVLRRDQLPTADAFISRNYGVTKLQNINP
ncbi:MAG: PDZ domain-containing protein [Sedimentisphaerales bacterium]|nr:PDZ domain-containing protein [Sedimentisphaerales bacterium]